MGFWSTLVSTLLGVAASLAAWYIIKSIKPRISISQEIEKTFFTSGQKEDVTYRIYVKNRSKKYKVYDVILQGRLIVKGLEKQEPNLARIYIIKVGTGATTYIGTSHENEKGKAFTVTIPTPKGEKGKLSRLYASYHNGEERAPFTIEDAFNISPDLDILLEISVMCCHGFSGTREVFIQQYHAKKDGTLPIISVQGEQNREIDAEEQA